MTMRREEESPRAPDLIVDLRGVRCPLNWAKAKVTLEGLERGAFVAFRLDDERGVRDMPRAAEAEGYQVVEVREEDGAWVIAIEK